MKPYLPPRVADYGLLDLASLGLPASPPLACAESKLESRWILVGVALLLGLVLVPALYAQPAVPRVKHVLHISVDGLRPDVVTSLGAERAPNFYRFRTEGAWTDNARTDQDLVYTLPNHTTQITGRHAFGSDGHGWFWNSDPGPITLHLNKGSYVASVFDVVHDHGRSTGLYAGKDKFVLFDNSYNGFSGAPDQVGADDGRDKIDIYRYNPDMAALLAAFTADFRAERFAYTLFHFRQPDGTGHASEWLLDPEAAYAEAVEEVDGLLGQVFDAVDRNAYLQQNLAIILTADHGGELGTENHINPFDADNYSVPFYVWGAGVAEGADLYALNVGTRLDPGARRPDRGEPVQPIRNGDAANLALALLGLPAVEGSTIGAAQDLRVAPTGDLAVRVFEQGLSDYVGTQDTYVREHKANASYGSSSILLVDSADPWWSGDENQALIRFDDLVGSGPGQIPSGAEVERAVLSLRVTNSGSGGEVHRMLAPWSEGATWNSLGSGVQTDDSEAVGVADAEADGAPKGSVSLDVTAGVRAWADGAVNHGWALLPGGSDGWDFYSAEGFMPPRLVVTYRAGAAIAAGDGALPNASYRAAVPSEVALHAGYPNPFAERATLSFDLPAPERVRLVVYDVLGREVALLAEGETEAGRHRVTFDGRSLPSGSYLVRFVTDSGFTGTQRLTLVR